MGKRKIKQEDWYIKTTNELLTYNKNKRRIELLEDKMEQIPGPTNKLVANYGGAVDVKQGLSAAEEIELYDLRGRVKNIEIALKALTEKELSLINLRFFEKHRDIIIYQMDQPMAATTYYKYLNEAVKTIAEILGILKKN